MESENRTGLERNGEAQQSLGEGRPHGLAGIKNAQQL